jgi:hypothetical protein
MRTAWVSWIILLPLIVSAQEISEVPPYNAPEPDNYPYVVSGAEGRFYARATPADNRGTTGVTKVYRVEEARRDKLLATYEWYSTSERDFVWRSRNDRGCSRTALQELGSGYRERPE